MVAMKEVPKVVMEPAVAVPVTAVWGEAQRVAAMAWVEGVAERAVVKAVAVKVALWAGGEASLAKVGAWEGLEAALASEAAAAEQSMWCPELHQGQR